MADVIVISAQFQNLSPVQAIRQNGVSLRNTCGGAQGISWALLPVVERLPVPMENAVSAFDVFGEPVLQRMCGMTSERLSSRNAVLLSQLDEERRYDKLGATTREIRGSHNFK